VSGLTMAAARQLLNPDGYVRAVLGEVVHRAAR
jgi:hypothetical protein